MSEDIIRLSSWDMLCTEDDLRAPRSATHIKGLMARCSSSAACPCQLEIQICEEVREN
jgi:hypothetical protein